MILYSNPITRINDKFIFDSSIDATPVYNDISHPLIKTGPNDPQEFHSASFYSKIALDIVTETVFDYPYPTITEKTLKPIACKRMFIVLGPAGILDLLKSKNFQTFDDILDESYDSIDDAMARFKSVVNSINNFLSLPLKEIKQYYQLNQQKFEHNFQTLKNLQRLEIEQIKTDIGLQNLNFLKSSV
jgi:hypothetical protein